MTAISPSSSTKVRAALKLPLHCGDLGPQLPTWFTDSVSGSLKLPLHCGAEADVDLASGSGSRTSEKAFRPLTVHDREADLVIARSGSRVGNLSRGGRGFCRDGQSAHTGSLLTNPGVKETRGPLSPFES